MTPKERHHLQIAGMSPLVPHARCSWEFYLHKIDLRAEQKSDWLTNQTVEEVGPSSYRRWDQDI